ncbi:MAG: hypothetical protein GY810_26970 [Aureispira sp.]|nr:hypothetical protein [Aureispira sp.]
MKKLNAIVAFLLLLVGATEVYAGGPWPKKKGSGYVQLGVYVIPPTNALFNNNFETRLLNRAVIDGTAQIYGEYGVLDKLTLSTSLPFKLVVAGEVIKPEDSTAVQPPSQILDSGTLFGLGNYELGAKYNFFNKSGFLVSGFVNFSMPTGVPLKSAKVQNTGLRTAHPTWGFMPGISIGYGADKLYTYLDVGANIRTHGYSHEIMANFEFGYKIWKLYLAVAIHARFALNKGLDIPETALDQTIHTGMYINNQNYLAWTAKVIIPFNDNFGANLSFSGAFMGENVQQSPSIGLGIYYQWDKKEKES